MDPRLPRPNQPQNTNPRRSHLSRNQPPQRQTINSHQAQPTNDAALEAVRQKIGRIYDDNNSGTSANRPAISPEAYRQAHKVPAEQINAEQWKQYHSSWQDYYQKYYEQYYIREMRKSMQNQPEVSSSTSSSSKPVEAISSNAPADDSDLPITQREALDKLRQNIRAKAQTTAKKARRSRHFIPVASAIAVVGVFAMLQYNQILVANVKAYVSPANIQPENIIVDPNSTVPVGPETKMIIPKINVDAPVVMNVGPTNADQMKAMEDGIAHVRYPGASSEPGQVGNSVFSAHSSSDWLDSGKYKFIFVQLERLAKGDVVYINYKSTQYTYKIYKTEVVSPSDTQALQYTGDDPIITLITCVPLGTAQNRLLVFAKQISPSPKEAKKASPSAAVDAPTNMAGTPPTFIERLFGAS